MYSNKAMVLGLGVDIVIIVGVLIVSVYLNHRVDKNNLIKSNKAAIVKLNEQTTNQINELMLQITNNNNKIASNLEQINKLRVHTEFTCMLNNNVVLFIPVYNVANVGLMVGMNTLTVKNSNVYLISLPNTRDYNNKFDNFVNNYNVNIAANKSAMWATKQFDIVTSLPKGKCNKKLHFKLPIPNELDKIHDTEFLAMLLNKVSAFVYKGNTHKLRGVSDVYTFRLNSSSRYMIQIVHEHSEYFIN